MDLIAILLVILIVVVAAVLFRFMRSSGTGGESMTLLQSQIAQLTQAQNDRLDKLIYELNERLRDQDKTINNQLAKSNQSIQQQFALSQKSLMEYTEKVKLITQEITKVSETGKNIQQFATQLQSLENILRNPKQRGVLGEYYLETVLRNVLPPDAYKLQFKFENGEIVDALIITRDGNIPVDAKFSLENYNRLSTAESGEDRQRWEKQFKQDLMKRIDETSKYIRPQEGTLDFAFMFVPADGLYYDLLVQKVGVIDVNQEGLIEYAFKRRVIMVSPTTFFAYLQTVLQGLRALRIEESTKEIQKQVEKLQKHLYSYSDVYQKLGKSLNVTVNAYNNATRELVKVDKDILKITASGDNFTNSIEIVDNPNSSQE
ncbi:MAG: DNA recombination protein RmuC [Candidatus Doudnabacteria bacterium]|nr:DNA recombination protein RmuC [Candidatus Doudnabacteria bacterium]